MIAQVLFIWCTDNSLPHIRVPVFGHCLSDKHSGDQMKGLTDEEKEYYQLVKKVFHILAPVYDIGTIPFLKLRDEVVDFVNAGIDSKILDVATGTGKQAFSFAKKGYDVTGIDISEDMLKVGNDKNKYENMKFARADATNLPFRDKKFDVSCVSFALHDMPLSIRTKALEEMVRVTKPEGFIVIVDYALPENRISKFLIYHFVKIFEKKYYSIFIKSDIEALFRKSGIEIKDELSVLLGAASIRKGVRINKNQ